MRLSAIVGVIIIVLTAAWSDCKKEQPMMPGYRSDKGSPRKLKRNQLDSENLASDAFNAVLDYLRESEGRQRDATALSMPQHWRAIYTTCCLDGEVNNGGHHQFFWNSDGALNKETLEDLSYMGAEPFVSIFRDALTVYLERDYAKAKRLSGNSWEGFTEGYRDKRLADCDGRFYKEKKSIYDYVAEFIRRHGDLYCEL